MLYESLNKKSKLKRLQFGEHVELSLEDVEIVGAKCLGELIEHSKTLKTLDVSYGMDDQSVSTLVEYMTKNTSLVNIDLSNTSYIVEDEFIGMLKANTSIRHIKIVGTLITREDAEKISAILIGRRK